MMEEKGGKGMAPQGAVRGHLKRVRGVGKDEQHRMAPRERRGDAPEDEETQKSPKPEVREEGLWRRDERRAPKNDAGNGYALVACRE